MSLMPYKTLFLTLTAGVIVAFSGLDIMVSLSNRVSVLLGLVAVLACTAWLACVHEYAHYYVALWLGAKDVVMTLSLSGFAVTYDASITPMRSALISIAGPISGVLLGGIGLVMYAAHVFSADTGSWLLLSAIIGCMQALFLGPFTADGQIFWSSVWNVIKRRLYESK